MNFRRGCFDPSFQCQVYMWNRFLYIVLLSTMEGLFVKCCRLWIFVLGVKRERIGNFSYLLVNFMRLVYKYVAGCFGSSLLWMFSRVCE